MLRTEGHCTAQAVAARCWDVGGESSVCKWDRKAEPWRKEACDPDF